MPDIPPSSIPRNAMRRLKGTRHEKHIDQSAFTHSPLERFILAFSSARIQRGQDWFKGHRVGCIDDPTLATELETRMRQAPTALCDKLRELYKEPDLSDNEAYDEIARLEQRYEDTKNPMWAWMTLDMYLQAGLPPPSWVWLYVADIAYQVARGAADDLPWFADNAKAKEKTHTDKEVAKVIGFPGDGKQFKRFRQEIREYRHRHRVNNLGQSAKSLKDACKAVAKVAASVDHWNEMSASAKAAAMRIYRSYQSHDDQRNTYPSRFSR